MITSLRSNITLIFSLFGILYSADLVGQISTSHFTRVFRGQIYQKDYQYDPCERDDYPVDGFIILEPGPILVDVWDGHFWFYIPENESYTAKTYFPDVQHDFYCPINGVQNIEAGTQLISKDWTLGLGIKSNSWVVISGDLFKPNKPGKIKISIPETSRINLEDYLSLKIPTGFEPSGFSLPPSSILGDSLVWEFGSYDWTPTYLDFIFSGQIFITGKFTNDFVDESFFEASSSLKTSNWENMEDNNFSYQPVIEPESQTLVKRVSPGPEIESGDWITYNLHFTNNSESTVNQIKIRDTLPPEVDLFTLRICDGSMFKNFTVKPGNVLEWDGLREGLEPDSQAIITYQIKSLDTLSEGTIIQTFAWANVNSDTSMLSRNAYNIIVSRLITSNETFEKSASELKVFPNPASNQIRLGEPFLNISTSVTIFNIQGAPVQSLVVTGKSPIELDNFPSGIYYIESSLNGRKIRGKFIKQ
jgi:uncharacterized repeat protein (TIGR01451 family)